MSNIQIQKTGVDVVCQGDACLPASDLERSKDQISQTAHLGLQWQCPFAWCKTFGPNALIRA
jgi:hypothetical protein